MHMEVRIFLKAKARYWAWSCMFGFELLKSVADALKFNV
jgi:hypothetical protein